MPRRKRTCEQCGKPLGPRRRRFCCTKCKDRWHNLNNPRGKFAHLKDQDPEWDEGDDTYWMGKD